MTLSRSTVIIVISSFVLSCLFAVFMLYAITDNNNQGEIYDTVTGAVDFPYVAKIFAIFFAVAYTVMVAIMFATRGVIRAVRAGKMNKVEH